MSSTPQRFACKGCGAEQYFAPEKKGLACRHCGAAESLLPATGFTAPEHPLVLEAPGETPPPSSIEPRASSIAPYGLEMAQRKCKQCGAAMSVPAGQKTSECAFCGSKFVEENKSTDQVEAPETVLPLAISSAQARQLYTDWIKKGWFTPSALKRENHLDKVLELLRRAIPSKLSEAHVFLQELLTAATDVAQGPLDSQQDVRCPGVSGVAIPSPQVGVLN